MNNLMRYMQLLLKWVLAAVLVLPGLVTAHVAVLDPPALQVHCYAQPDFWSGSPADPGCNLLNTMSGTYPGQQWPEVAKLISSDDGYDYNDQATVERLIPKGKLCSAADPLKEGLNIVSAAWHTTPVQLNNGVLPILIGGGIVHTPSDLYIYLTKPTFDPITMVLGWGDLVLLKKEIITQSLNTPPPNFNVPFNTNSYYTTSVTIPSGQTGDAILFMRNQRHDRFGEGFYNCVRITINDGGSVPPRWYAKGPFIPQGFAPKAGDTIRYREFSPDESKNEQFDIRLLVTSAELRVWALDLMNALKPHSDKVQVGVLKDDKVVPDTTTLTNNQNYLSKANGSIAMSIIPGEGGGNPDPRPPIAVIKAPATVESGKLITIDGSGSTFYNQGQKIYQWSATHGLTPLPDAAVVTPTAPTVTTPTDVTLYLAVYDGVNKTKSTQVVSTVRVTPPGGGGTHPEYIEGTAYKDGDIVSNTDSAGNKKNYKCKPAPFTAWCAGAAWAYSPGNGTAWALAWDLVP